MTALDDPLVIATFGLMSVTVGLVIVTSVYAYYTKRLSEHTARQAELLKGQEVMLKKQILAAIHQTKAQMLVAIGVSHAPPDTSVQGELKAVMDALENIRRDLEGQRP